MLFQKRLQQFGDLTPALMPTDEDHRLAGLVVDRSDAVALFGLSGRLDHHLLALWAPHGLDGLEGGHPAQVELVGVVEDFSFWEVVAGLFDRLFLRAYSGSRSEEHTSELQSRQYLVCRLLLEKKKTM